MASLTATSRLGQVNAAGSDTALFLKVFSGEVLAALERQLKVRQYVTKKTISFGESAQFPATGLATAKHHVAGESILTTAGYLDQINANEVNILVDRPLLGGPVAIDSWDEMVNHYDVRAPYARQIGQAIGKVIDQRLIIAGILGARAAATVTGLPAGASAANVGGNTAPAACTNANMRLGGADLLVALFAASQRLDENDVDDMDRFALVTPQQYNGLVQNQDLLNRDFAGGKNNGVFADGTVWKAAGFTLVKTNSLAPVQVNIAANPTGARNTYSGDFSKNAGLCFHSSGIGHVMWSSMVTESEYSMEYQAHLMLGKYTCGSKWLRPETLVELMIP